MHSIDRIHSMFNLRDCQTNPGMLRFSQMSFEILMRDYLKKQN